MLIQLTLTVALVGTHAVDSGEAPRGERPTTPALTASSSLMGTAIVQWLVLQVNTCSSAGWTLESCWNIADQPLGLRLSTGITLFMGSAVLLRSLHRMGFRHHREPDRPGGDGRRAIAVGVVTVLTAALGFLGARVLLYEATQGCGHDRCLMNPSQLDAWSRALSVATMIGGSCALSYGLGRRRAHRRELPRLDLTGSSMRLAF